ncbi:snRNA-activating protein complex subunit 1-like [Mya arenaria]|uniref:snRNA-activating protein complex subunit 1-like n=1 Tax=Mya arenaria TaxID=6604 RepID=UPI0022E3B174|nr:snRNA-activating protein complex subunit 1-like [Mya arenaria]
MRKSLYFILQNQNMGRKRRHFDTDYVREKQGKVPKLIHQPELGFKQDIETLLQRFSESGTVRYEKFAEIWRDMNFSFFCAGRQSQRECREYVEEVFQVAIPYWLPPSSFLARAGALYMLYGMYNHQLVVPKVKIRVSPAQWQTIQEFQQEARDQQHLDLDYVFQKMCLEHAFQFVATSREMYQTGRDRDLFIADDLKEEASCIEEIFSSQTLNQLSLVHDQYQKMKVALSSDNTTPDSSLNIAPKDWIEKIYRTLRNYKEKQTSHHTAAIVDPSAELKDASSTEVSMKKKLKAKAFVQTTGFHRTRERVKKEGLSLSEEEEMLSEENKPNVDHNWPFDEKSLRNKPRGRGRHKIAELYAEEDDAPTTNDVVCLTDKISMPDFDKLTEKLNAANKGSTSESEDVDLVINDKVNSGKGKQPVRGKARRKSSGGSKSKTISIQKSQNEPKEESPIRNRTEETVEVESVASKKTRGRAIVKKVKNDEKMGNESVVLEKPKPQRRKSSGKRTGSVDEMGDNKESVEDVTKDKQAAQEKLHQRLNQRKKNAREKTKGKK